jgi:hypothetical protein
VNCRKKRTEATNEAIDAINWEAPQADDLCLFHGSDDDDININGLVFSGDFVGPSMVEFVAIRASSSKNEAATFRRMCGDAEAIAKMGRGAAAESSFTPRQKERLERERQQQRQRQQQRERFMLMTKQQIEDELDEKVRRFLLQIQQ